MSGVKSSSVHPGYPGTGRVHARAGPRVAACTAERLRCTPAVSYDYRALCTPALHNSGSLASLWRWDRQFCDRTSATCPDLACTALRHSIGVHLSQCGTYRMDHQKFLVYGVGMFSGIITALFPLSVIKIRQMSSTDCSPGLAGARDTGRQILRQEGIRGLYRGYGTVLAGAIPVRRRPSAPNQSPSSQLPSNVQRLFSGAGHSGAS